MKNRLFQAVVPAAVALGLVTSLTLGPPAAGDSIAELYEAAKANDPILGRFYAGYQSRKTQVVLARSQLLPASN